MTYVGRFAPSPTGPLHIGSLTTAVASYLHAKQASGEWLVRLEDIDPPREVSGAADGILRTLESFDLPWDRSVLYQSARLADYRETANALLRDGSAFLCSCTRSELRAHGKGAAARYPGTCRRRREHARETAVRVRVDPGRRTFDDGLQGRQSVDLHDTTGDYVIVRRDGLVAYRLAVVADDAHQGVTTVVRGVDLLESTGAHLHLQTLLKLAEPRYFHLPVVANRVGQKLSKQTRAQPVDAMDRAAAAAQVLRYLGLHVPDTLRGAAPAELWAWAIEHWDIDALAGRRQIVEKLVEPSKVD